MLELRDTGAAIVQQLMGRRIDVAVGPAALVASAVQHYRERWTRLTNAVPEFGLWAALPDMPSDRVGAPALGDLPQVMASFVPKDRAGDAALTSGIDDCHTAHCHVLGKPLLVPRLDADLEGLTFPAIHDGYVSPNFRIYRTLRSDEGSWLAQAEHWQPHRPRGGLAAHLGGYLRTPAATLRPLLVLGDPGSGKSLLSKVLAARLPPNEYAVARVELRHVRSAQEVSDQIDLELQRQTNKRFTLADLTDPDGRITRVVIMDGLDELLQLSAHEDLGRYLERLVEFQEVEAAYGRPVIIIATARTIVMDRVFVPAMTTVIRLEDFTDDQIGAWITIWNQHNEGYFTSRHLDPLDPAGLGRYSDLARQPLLLALLALYDAEGNALAGAGELSRAELYERLSRRYLEREIGKKALPAREPDRDQQVEQRFRELSTIAMGMLNRGRRFITRHELEEDYLAAGIRRAERTVSADDAVGQFFFLYRAMAQHRGASFHEGYEFIHATFEEFLGARMIAQQLAQATRVLQQAPDWTRAEAERHARSLLAPYLSRRPLAGEEQVLEFLGQIVGGLVGDRMAAATDIAGLMPSVLRDGTADGVASMATLSLNLVVAAPRTADAPVPLAAFCLPAQDAGQEWRRLVGLWRAYLAGDDWDRALHSLGRHQDSSLRTMPGGSATPMLLAPAVRRFGLERTVQEAALVADADLVAAATLWSQVHEELDWFEGDPRSVRLLAARPSGPRREPPGTC